MIDFMGKTLAEKILSEKTDQESVEPGDFILARVDRALSHDNTFLVSQLFQSIEGETVWDPEKMTVVLDHRTPANHENSAKQQKYIRSFVAQQKIPHFFDIGQGICHQILPEHGFVRPGELIVGSDSHTTTHGALGAFATGIGATDMAMVWTTGKLWMKVPESIQCRITGSLAYRVTPKDCILHLIGTMGSCGANYCSVEFTGDTIGSMNIDGRLCICNQSMEMGAKTAIIPPDTITKKYLHKHSSSKTTPLYADKDAEYCETIDISVDSLSPQVSCPHQVDHVKPASELQDVPVDQAVIGSCTNGRLSDLELAASILNTNKVHPYTRLLIIPASQSIYLQALNKGYIQSFLQAGAVVLNPGCGPCLGLHQGVLAPGETAITTTNRNFKGRMGSQKAKIYLASPATVAASAITGTITDPCEVKAE